MDVQIRTDYPAGAAISQSDIEVYHGDNLYLVDNFEKAATISTNESGYASGESITVDSYYGEEEYYYFKFTRNGIDYKSETVTLAELAEGTTVTGKIQANNSKTVSVGEMQLKFNGADYKKQTHSDGSVSWQTSSGYSSGSFNLGKYNGTDGKNASAINIQYADSETITFIFGSYSGTFTIDQVGNGKVINLTK